MAKKYHTFDGMCWPLPGDEPDGDGLEWRLRYASNVSKTDLLHAASIVSAYRELIGCSVMKKNRILRVLRAELGNTGDEPICTCPDERPETMGHADDCPRKLGSWRRAALETSAAPSCIWRDGCRLAGVCAKEGFCHGRNTVSESASHD